jgi:hypothetical protein
MKKRVNYITIAILAFYIGVPLMIGAANILTLQNEQNELRQMLRKANLGNAEIKTISITGAEVNTEQLHVTNDIKSKENSFMLYLHVIEDIYREGDTLHIELKKHPSYHAQKCYFIDAIFIKTLEKVLLNGEDWTDKAIIVEPKIRVDLWCRTNL